MTVQSPDLKNVKAIVTTKWTAKGYRPLTVDTIEGYYLDTALDNDADSWQIAIGDPDGDLMPMIDRDNEVRVQLFGFRPNRASYIMTGIADTLGYSEEGVWTITGRDLSSLATDSTVPPQFFKHVRANAIVDRQAKQLGFRKTQLSHAGVVKKTQYTDASESYWEFWYRLYRKEKMWIWTEPDGMLIAGKLNYEQKPTYYFGIPKKSEASNIRSLYLPIEHAEWSRSTQARMGHVWVYGHKGDNGFLVRQEDPTTRGWVKRSRKIMLDQDAKTTKSAQKLAKEEIFEGKVGENELKITIADPGFEIRQNKMAVVRIPDKGYEATMFVVGVREQASPDGLVCEVRLREKNYAVSRRVPKDPKIQPNAPSPKGGTTLSGLLQGDWPAEWTPYFVKAATQFNGPWNFNLFLATLIGIAHQETGGSFLNERENGGPGGDHEPWYQWRSVLDPQADPQHAATGNRDSHGRNIVQWQELFANEPGNYVSRQYGVGPMQLTSIGLKQDADDHMREGFRDQYKGGRWHPEHNIWIGASYLRSCLKSVVGDSGNDIDMWSGVAAYNAGAANWQAGKNYAQNVKGFVYTDPGYLQTVKDARQEAIDAAKNARDGETDAVDAIDGNYTGPDGLPSMAESRAFFLQFNPGLADALEKRMAIVMTAMWGYYNRDAMNYLQTRPMPDMAPPPNVPLNCDCSQFATWCYKSAGAADPNGLGYNGQGYTGTLWTHGRPVTYGQLQPGDLVFYANPTSTHSHVTVYVGNGKVVSHGQQAGPLLEAYNVRSDIAGYRTYSL